MSDTATRRSRPRCGTVSDTWAPSSKAVCAARKPCAERVRIRLCKGACMEGPDIAFPDKADMDARFVRCMKALLDSGVYHGIATHDERPANLAFVVRHLVR